MRQGSIGLVIIAAVIALLHSLGGCTPVMPSTSAPMPENHITLEQQFNVHACTRGGESVEMPSAAPAAPGSPTPGARAPLLPRRTAATDQVAAANGCSIALSYDVWIMGTSAAARSASDASASAPVQVSPIVNATGSGAASSTGGATMPVGPPPTAPAAPAAPAVPE